MQLEMGISTRRYLPASGTAGLERSLVSGKRRAPWPPPIMTDSTLLVLIDCRPESDIQSPFRRASLRLIPVPAEIASRFGPACRMPFGETADYQSALHLALTIFGGR